MRRPSLIAIAVLGGLVVAGLAVVGGEVLDRGPTGAVAPKPVQPGPEPGPQDASRFVVPSSIDSTGETDVTDLLTAFLASVPDGSIIEFRAGSRYRIEGTVLLERRNQLQIEGNGAVFLATTEGSRNRSHWRFDGGRDITLRDVTVIGANPNAGMAAEAGDSDLEAQHAFLIKGVDGFLLERARASDVWGDFVYLGEFKGAWAKNVTVRDSHFERNGRQGIAITAAEGVLIEGNYIGDVRRTTIDIEPFNTDGGAAQVRIVNNTFGDSRLRFFSAGGRAGRVEDIEISGNLLYRKMGFEIRAPEGSRRARITISGNVSEIVTPGAAVVRAWRVDDLVVRGNRQAFRGQEAAEGAAVVLTDSCALVEGNDFPGIGELVRSDGRQCPTGPGG